jgi:hypothetical protein
MEEKYEVLKDVIDIHIHAAPDVFPRRLDEIEVVRQARSVGMGGVLLKSHHALTSDRAWLISKIESGIGVYGALVLNYPSAGGLNAEAVDTAIKLGAREIFMPTVSAANHLQHEGKDPAKGIKATTSKGELRPEVFPILDLVAKADVILATGHLSVSESEVLIDEASQKGVKKILVTHPEWRLIAMPVEVQRRLVEKGAIMEHCLYATTQLGGSLNPEEIAKQIKSVGAENCIMSTDFGQKVNPLPIDGMVSYIELMRKHGISSEAIDVMTKENPKKILKA